MKAYIELIKVGLRKGYSIAVHSEEELELTSKDYDEIVDMVENLDMSCIEFLDDDGLQQGWASVNLCVHPWETVSDYGMNSKWIDQWFNEVVATYDPYERDTMPEADEFVDQMVKRYSIQLKEDLETGGWIATMQHLSVIAKTQYQAVKYLYDVINGQADFG